MERLTVCRMCLNASVIYPIKDSQLQEVYEKLTSVTNTLKPLLICCICRAQLRKTRRLMIQCLKTEELLTQMLNQQLVTEDEIQQQSLKITHANITPFLTIAIVGHISIEGTSAEVKEEIPIITHEKDAKYVTIKTERLEDDDNNQFTDIPQLADDTHRGSNNTNRNHEQTPSETAKAISLKYKYLKSETVSNKGIKNRVTKKDRIGRRKAVPIAQKSKTATQNRKIGEYDTESVLDDLRQCKLSQNNNKISESGTKDCNIDACSGNKTQFVCDICSKDFDCRRKLTRHIRLHTDEKQHVCNICYKRFTQLINLKSHLRIHTGERPYACKLCDKRFTQLSSLTTHRLLHTGERPHLCKICDKRFTQVSNLKKHARTHSGEKPYACNVCDKRFSDKSDLKKHALIHTGERRYTCGVCDKRFTEKGALKTHVRIHTDEKPYICNTCDKRFTQKSNLRLHTRVHTGEKPYTCRVCNKKFTGKNDLTRHERIHTGEKPYLCDICAMTFRRPSAVKSHLKLHKCNT